MAIFSPSTASGYTKLRGKEVTVTTSYTPVLDIRDADNNSFNAINMEMFDLFNITVINKGTATITDLRLMHSPDGENWEIVEDAFFDNIVANSSRSLENIDNIRSYFKVEAITAAGTATVIAVIEGRVLV